VEAALLGAGAQQLRLAHLSVSELPGSGTATELLAAAGIDAAHIAAAAAALVGGDEHGGAPTCNVPAR
jgi:transketolase